MAETPAYPEEAAVGDGANTKSETPKGETNEAQPEGTRNRKFVAGAAIGVGSAALVAALLYANRSRKGGSKGS